MWTFESWQPRNFLYIEMEISVRKRNLTLWHNSSLASMRPYITPSWVWVSATTLACKCYTTATTNHADTLQSYIFTSTEWPSRSCNAVPSALFANTQPFSPCLARRQRFHTIWCNHFHTPPGTSFAPLWKLGCGSGEESVGNTIKRARGKDVCFVIRKKNEPTFFLGLCLRTEISSATYWLCPRCWVKVYVRYCWHLQWQEPNRHV